MQPRVIGIDLSLSATGVAIHTEDGQALSTTIRTGPGDHLADQHDRITHIISEINGRLHNRTALAVLEGPSYGSRGAGTWDRAGLWWMTYHLLHSCAVPTAVIPPATLKRFATGRGNATKTDMAVALAKRTDGLEMRDDNRVDAWWLAAAGREHLGHPIVSLPKAQRDALASADWPEVPDGS